ncbi:hypothetical protein ACFQ12_03935, partial [Methylobacterium trifolii]
APAVSTGARIDARFPRARPGGPQGGGGMAPELRDSRAALILLAAVVLSVLIFGAVTLVSQIG